MSEHRHEDGTLHQGYGRDCWRCRAHVCGVNMLGMGTCGECGAIQPNQVRHEALKRIDKQRREQAALEGLGHHERMDHEHKAWLVVVEELRARGAGEIERGEKDHRLHDAIVWWGEELAQLRIHDPNPEHALNALSEKREAWVAHEQEREGA